MKHPLLLALLQPARHDYEVCVETENGPQRISGVQWDNEKKIVVLKTAVALSLLTPE